MQIINVHRNSPVEMRFTIVDGDRETVRMIFVNEDAAPDYVMETMAANITHYCAIKDAGFPHDYNSAQHIADIMSDAAYYGTD